jgi:hypothetical protein
MSAITEDMRKALHFIKDFRISTSEWLKNGKSASGHPSTWTHLRMTGPEASITITSKTQKAIRPYTEVGPIGNSMYALNDAGLAALKATASLSPDPDREGRE